MKPADDRHCVTFADDRLKRRLLPTGCGVRSKSFHNASKAVYRMHVHLPQFKTAQHRRAFYE